MSRRRHELLLAELLRRDDWATAGQLADVLGVTPRSVRGYVAALNAAGERTVESGPRGYRAGTNARAALQAVRGDEPRDRLHGIVRALVDDDRGIDVFATAARLHVSEATVESDLGRVRALLDDDLQLLREREVVRLSGSELAKRRLLARLAHDEVAAVPFRTESALRAIVDESRRASIATFKRELVDELTALGYFVNELAIADVLLHVTIAADRVAAGRPLDRGGANRDDAVSAIGAVIARLAGTHLDVALGSEDADHLAALVRTRIVTPGDGATAPARATVDERIATAVRTEVERAAEAFAIDLADDDFVLRLALHVQNLMRRADAQAWSRNPLTRTMKSSFPMVFEVALSIAHGLHALLGAPVDDDEIAYLAMHVGGRLERSRVAESVLTATIVCPGYAELQELLRSSVRRSLGSSLEVVHVVTRVDPDWAAIDADLVLSTIDPDVVDDRIVRIQPLLTDQDVARVQHVAARLRRARRLARLRDELSRYVSAEAFVRPLPDEGEEAAIRRLGGLLVASGAIDDAHVERAIARERMSSTAFTDALAVPHALEMTASRTALAVGIADGSVRWGTGRVQVVAFAAFSEHDREAFQTVFEQLVEVFSESESVRRIVQRGTTFHGLLDELAAVIDG